MAIKISGDEIRFTSSSGEITTYKQEDAKEVFVDRKAASGLKIRKLRAMESASTFIDLGGTHQSPGDRIDMYVKDTFEAFSISAGRISLGPKETVPIELTGSLKVRPSSTNPHDLQGKYQFSGNPTGFGSAGEGVEITGSLDLSGSFDLSGSMDVTGSYANYNFESMSMNVYAGGFFGVGVSGSTYANNAAQFYIDFIQSGSTTFQGGNFDVEVEESGSSFTISGSEGVTLIVSGGTSEFTGGVTITGSFPNSSSLDLDQALIVSGNVGVVGDVVLDGNIAEGFSNDVQVTSSLTLTNMSHGMGRQVRVRSGSNPLLGVDVQPSMSLSHPYYGLPQMNYDVNGVPINNTGQYISNPAGVIRLELPSASVGLSFDIICQQQHSFLQGSPPTSNPLRPPTLNLTPNGSEKFIYNVAGNLGINGKGLLLLSSSYQNYARVHVTCQSGSDWTIVNLNGQWIDEA
jgi:hypothetical protein